MKDTPKELSEKLVKPDSSYENRLVIFGVVVSLDVRSTEGDAKIKLQQLRRAIERFIEQQR